MAPFPPAARPSMPKSIVILTGAGISAASGLATFRDADLFVAIGTSGTVYPAAGFVQQAKRAGASTIEINLDQPDHSAMVFDEHITGNAAQTVPEFVERLLAQDN